MTTARYLDQPIDGAAHKHHATLGGGGERMGAFTIVEHVAEYDRVVGK